MGPSKIYYFDKHPFKYPGLALSPKERKKERKKERNDDITNAMIYSLWSL